MTSLRCKAILFDMDGTLVDSTQCVEDIWHRWAERHAFDSRHILSISHGRRTLDTLNDFAQHLDIEKEAALLDAEELESRQGIEAVKGAAALLNALPPDRWAVVTSASRALAEVRFGCAGLPLPEVLVSSDDVSAGKPSPEGYLTAARRLNVPAGECLVIEDTPPGISAGRTAGMQVLAITTTFPAASLLNAYSVADFRQVRTLVEPWGIELQIPDIN